MKIKLRKINVKPAALIFGALNLVMGFIIAVILTIASFLSDDDQLTMGIGPWIILVFPVLNMVMGLAGGAFLSGCYNFLSKILGGLEFDFEEK